MVPKYIPSRRSRMGDYAICRFDNVHLVAAGQTVAAGALWAAGTTGSTCQAPSAVFFGTLFPGTALSLVFQPTQHFSGSPRILLPNSFFLLNWPAYAFHAYNEELCHKYSLQKNSDETILNTESEKREYADCPSIICRKFSLPYFVSACSQHFFYPHHSA